MTSQTPNPYPVPYYLRPVDVEEDLFDNTVRSLQTMPSGFITDTTEETTPYIDLDLPDFLVGVPMTRHIDWGSKSFSFDSGDIHAYGLRRTTWTPGAEPGTRLIYSETGIPTLENPIEIYYKRFTEPKFSISGDSYIWFFTRTPPAVALSQLGTIIGRGVTIPGAIFTEKSNYGGIRGTARAFNGSYSETHSVPNGAISVNNSQWLQVQFPYNVTVKRYRMWSSAGSVNTTDRPVDWTLQGSTDGSTWTILDTRTNSTLPYRSTNPVDNIVALSESHGTFYINTPRPYTYYRLDVTKTVNRADVLKIAEIEFLDN